MSTRERLLLLAAVLTHGAALLCLHYGRKAVFHLGVREMFLLTTSVWVVACIFGALPFFFINHIDFTDAYFEAGVKSWDIAAGILLVREAGGKVCDFRGAALGKIDGRTALPRQIVAGNLKVAEALQKTIVSSGYATAFNA